MNFQTVEDYDVLSASAAQTVEVEARLRPGLILVAAAGASPLGTYRALGQRALREPSPLGQIRIVKLDEWAGLAMDDPASCELSLRAHLLRPLRIPEAHYLGFAGDAADPALECTRVAARLSDWGPADLAVLGLGRNGHLGFIEPAVAFPPHAHVARLSETSLGHAMLAEARGPVRHGLTLGMADLLACRRVLLLVSGAHKRAALARLRRSAVTCEFPASFLWLHPQVTCLCDRAAV